MIAGRRAPVRSRSREQRRQQRRGLRRAAVGEERLRHGGREQEQRGQLFEIRGEFHGSWGVEPQR